MDRPDFIRAVRRVFEITPVVALIVRGQEKLGFEFKYGSAPRVRGLKALVGR